METMNKRGWLRIFEAFLGILIIFGVILFVYSKQEVKTDRSDYIYEIQKSVLDTIEVNESLRSFVLNNNQESIDEFAKSKIPAIFSYEIKICELNNEVNCKKTPPYVEVVYVKDKIISSNLTINSIKKVRLFLWEK